ncbi:hypothetical protein J1P26_25025 [Neobacillus sp. MM2021_6]|uniref:hypothetical protein n=1 Tax=Bacillaceae TaxID=186817 RepID=UPI00140E149A|nr:MULTISPECIES: hypothetical protein [Bacillaceae]MBO0962939.1 hypothetical protein [Neobacillus sp. MM2021_6]NHC21217.1 hypothetical protein [Bacillus sp. MM2020_4]
MGINSDGYLDYKSDEIKKAFTRGFKRGEEYAKKEIKENRMLQSLFLELIGYEDEWLTTESGYKKYKKAELIEVILKQRSLIRAIYEKFEESERDNLKVKIEKFLWPVMYQD